MAREDRLIEILPELLALPAENRRVEFKLNKIDPDKFGRYVSALANGACLDRADEGWLIAGITDDTHKVVGTSLRFHKIKVGNQDLELHLRKLISPCIDFSFHAVEYGGVHLEALYVSPAPGQPVRYNGRAYIRMESHTTELDQYPDLMRDIYNSERDWSAEVVPGAELSDLDEEALRIAREGFVRKHANRFSEDEVRGWPLATFLNRAKLTINGKVTRTALLLLGKAESVHFLSPHPAQMTWKLVGEEQAYEHFGPPFLLNTTQLYRRIRNIQIRILPHNSLLSVEIPKYLASIVLEGLHNCIAHQDYTRNGRIIVTEYVDRLTMLNEGDFYDGKPSDYLTGNKTPTKYRNRMLATAMSEINMIDTMGYGIHSMCERQARRGLPLQDYEKLQGPVTMTIYGHVIDEAYSTILLRKTSLSMEDIVALDSVQKGLRISDIELQSLRTLGFIKGRRPHIRLSAEMSAAALYMQAQAKSKKEKQEREERAKVSMAETIQYRMLFTLHERGIMDAKTLAGELGIEPQVQLFRNNRSILLNLGFIELTLPDKATSPLQKYRITHKGEEQLSSMRKSLAESDKAGKADKADKADKA